MQTNTTQIYNTPATPIFLIGFMGSGKTFLGKQLAEKLQFPFFDIDLEIEKKSNMNVIDIFQHKGEKYFREVETEVLQNWNQNGIIATGGGIVISKINREFFKKKEYKVIWLNPLWEVIRSRIINSYRPIVLERTEDELFELWNKRTPLYKECADISCDARNLEILIEAISNDQ